MRPGMEGRQVDEMARKIMEKAGYTYSHGSGHVVGVALHDGPDTPVLGDLSARKLEVSSFATGVYTPMSACGSLDRVLQNGGEFAFV